METKNEYIQVFENFNDRMKFVNIVNGFKIHNIPQQLLGTCEEMEQLSFSTLLFVMDYVLTNNKVCPKNSIIRFINDVKFDLNIVGESEDVYRFIVIDVLQNKGKIREFNVYNEKLNCYEKKTVRLINQSIDGFSLTDDCLDFLFRTKEIDDELNFQVTTFKLAQYIKRGNYKEALKQSKELRDRIRIMKLQVIDFENRCRQNINAIAIDEYEAIYTKIRNLLQTEYEELEIIRKESEVRLNQINNAEIYPNDRKDYEDKKRDVLDIIINIKNVLAEQRTLINREAAVAELYTELTNDNFYAENFERFDFDDIIMSAVRKDEIDVNKISKLLVPFIKPELEGIFNLENIYYSEFEKNEVSVNKGIDLTSGGDILDIELKKRTDISVAIMEKLIHFSSVNNQFDVASFIEFLGSKTTSEYCYMSILPNIFLVLYENANSLLKDFIDLEEFREELYIEGIVLGEIDLSYCFNRLRVLMQNIKMIFVETGPEFEFEFESENDRIKIRMSNFNIEVVKYE